MKVILNNTGSFQNKMCLLPNARGVLRSSTKRLLGSKWPQNRNGIESVKTLHVFFFQFSFVHVCPVKVSSKQRKWFINFGLLLTEWVQFPYFTVYSNRLHALMRGCLVSLLIRWIYNCSFTVLFICLKTWCVPIFPVQSCYMQTPRGNIRVKFDPKTI